jgi:putative transposase
MLEFSTSGYYDWLKTRVERDNKQKKYEEAITKIFNDSEKTYGPDRVCGVLRRQGYTASYKRVARIMKRLGLSSVHNRRCQRSLTDSRQARGKEWPNLIQPLEDFKLFQVVTSDISYIRTSEGFEYLCKIRDVDTGTVLAHTMADSMKAELVTKTIKKAKKRWNLPEACIHHSDLGAQYTAKETQELLKQLGFQQSFSRPDKPGGNAWSESFFSILKKETVHWRNFQTRAEARQAIFAYIEGFYNTRRVQKRLGYLSPMELLNHYTEELFMSVA